jgi:hypothetical protein
MGSERGFTPGLLVLAVLRRPSVGREELGRELLGLPFGLRAAGPELPFTFNPYYAAEMGEELLRSFFVSRELFDPAGLAEAKRLTDGLERRTADEGGGRRLNLDPGFLSLGNFILATTKARAHRIPLSGGIYAELTLIYEGGAWRSLPWTYPDWRSEAYRDFLGEERAGLKPRLRLREGGGGALPSDEAPPLNQEASPRA